MPTFAASFRLAPLALAAAAALAVPPVHAQTTAEPTREQGPLPKITVTATRTERATNEVPATVTVINHEQLAERDARDLKALLDDEVDLAVRAAQPRFTAALASTGRAGNEGLNIRGLEGNQVLLLLDGVRLPNAFSFGAFSTSRLDSIDPDLLVQAEVLRGPSSSQFGSDGLAGALSLTMLRPQDLLVNGKTSAGFVKLGANSVDSSVSAVGAYALGGAQWQGLVAVSHRQGHELDNQGRNDSADNTRTTPNPLDYQATGVLGSVGFQLNAQHRLEATLDARQRDTQVNVLSAVVANPTASTHTLALTGDDEVERERLSVWHRYSNARAPFLTKWTTHLYGQRSESHQYTEEDRFTAADRTREGTYTERVIGLTTQGEAVLRGALPQRLSFGLDLSQTQISGVRDGTVPPAGETFPSNPFPDTRYRTLGAFAQTEIDTESFTIIPALRFDKFSLSPKDTAGFSGTPVSLSDQALTPRLGAIWRVSPGFQPYAQWSMGFRAPLADQVNNGFSNPAVGYVSIGNPDLKPEHARSIELGARGRHDALDWQVAWFDNRYRDFISQQLVGGSFTPTDPAVYQYINLTDARIRGGELRLGWKPTGTPFSGQFALARTQGSYEEDGVREPLDTIQPLRMRLALRYEQGPWSLMGQWQHAEGKAAKDVDSAVRNTQFLPPSSDVIDLFATWRLNSTWSVRAAMLNVFDETYWRWSEANGLSSTSTTLDAFTAPGRSVQLALRADF